MVGSCSIGLYHGPIRASNFMLIPEIIKTFSAYPLMLYTCIDTSLLSQWGQNVCDHGDTLAYCQAYDCS